MTIPFQKNGGRLCSSPTCTSTQSIPARPAGNACRNISTCGPAARGSGFWARGISPTPPGGQELRDKLVPAEEGLYTLREEFCLLDRAPRERSAARFVVTGEISSIYKKDGRVRKVHNLILLPGLEAAEALSKKLEAIGNIHSDGRPILGLDSRDLLEITLECLPRGGLYPRAHLDAAFFPLRGVFGLRHDRGMLRRPDRPTSTRSRPGFPPIPPMNWRLSALDRYTLVSNSDAHSPSKLGPGGQPAGDRALLSRAGLGAARARRARLSRARSSSFPRRASTTSTGTAIASVCLRPGDTAGRRALPRLRRQADDRRAPPGGGARRPGGGLRSAGFGPLPEPRAPARGDRRLHRLRTGERPGDGPLRGACCASSAREFHHPAGGPGARRSAGWRARLVAEGVRRMRRGSGGALARLRRGVRRRSQLLDPQEIGTPRGADQPVRVVVAGPRPE